MATFKKKDEKLMQCPYNKVHMMKPSTYQAHLTKCRKDHLNKNFKSCPYNAQHVIQAEELHIHIATCPDKALVDRQVMASTTNFMGAVHVPSYDNDANHVKEYWDDDDYEPGPGYDPKKKIENQVIFRDTANWKPLEKREYYKNLHQQGSIQSAPPLQTPTSVQRPVRAASTESSESTQFVGSERVPTDVSEVNRNMVDAGMGRGASRARGRLAARFSADQTTVIPVGRGRGMLSTMQPTVILPNAFVENEFPPLNAWTTHH